MLLLEEHFARRCLCNLLVISTVKLARALRTWRVITDLNIFSGHGLGWEYFHLWLLMGRGHQTNDIVSGFVGQNWMVIGRRSRHGCHVDFTWRFSQRMDLVFHLVHEYSAKGRVMLASVCPRFNHHRTLAISIHLEVWAEVGLVWLRYLLVKWGLILLNLLLFGKWVLLWLIFHFGVLPFRSLAPTSQHKWLIRRFPCLILGIFRLWIFLSLLIILVLFKDLLNVVPGDIRQTLICLLVLLRLSSIIYTHLLLLLPFLIHLNFSELVCDHFYIFVCLIEKWVKEVHFAIHNDSVGLLLQDLSFDSLLVAQLLLLLLLVIEWTTRAVTLGNKLARRSLILIAFWSVACEHLSDLRVFLHRMVAHEHLLLNSFVVRLVEGKVILIFDDLRRAIYHVVISKISMINDVFWRDNFGDRQGNVGTRLGENGISSGKHFWNLPSLSRQRSQITLLSLVQRDCLSCNNFPYPLRGGQLFVLWALLAYIWSWHLHVEVLRCLSLRSRLICQPTFFTYHLLLLTWFAHYRWYEILLASYLRIANKLAIVQLSGWCYIVTLNWTLSLLCFCYRR